jgi:hypothetical protein
MIRVLKPASVNISTQDFSSSAECVSMSQRIPESRFSDVAPLRILSSIPSTSILSGKEFR